MKIAIISGASSGIGMELAMLLDSYMLDELWLISRNYDKLLELSNKLKTKSRLISVDLSTEDAYYTIKKLLNEFNPETDVNVGDIVVYNAKWFNSPVIHRVIEKNNMLLVEVELLHAHIKQRPFYHIIP